MDGDSFIALGVEVFDGESFRRGDIFVSGGRFADAPPADAQAIDFARFPFRVAALPGLCDCHVHLREPGFSHKETIATGTAAAAAGGFTDVCAMPNLDPVPDCLDSLRPELGAIARSARIRVHPFGAITKGEKGRELADFAALAPHVAGFSDDGKGLQDKGLAREAFAAIRETGKTVSAHCEVESLVPSGGCVHDGRYALAHCLSGIPSSSEWKMVERDMELVRDTGVRYHVCHISTKESAEIVREAKKDGLPVTCETAPHYLLLTEDDLLEDGRFKMNPPLRSRFDREALLEALEDGTIDCIATDHAPHAEAEKAKGLAGSAFGIVGLETSLALCWTHLVERGIVTLERLVECLSANPRRVFGLPETRIAPGRSADVVFVALGVQDNIDTARFLSKGRATPFAGWTVSARILRTILGGKTVFSQ